MGDTEKNYFEAFQDLFDFGEVENQETLVELIRMGHISEEPGEGDIPILKFTDSGFQLYNYLSQKSRAI